MVNSNWRAEAAATTMANFDAAKIPAVSNDVVHPNAIFFGSNSYVSGEIGGKAAGTYAQGLGHCADAIVLEGMNPGEGDAADQRLAGFTDGVQEICGAHCRPSASVAAALRPGHAATRRSPRPPTG